jgi:hypothetical protein
MLLDQQRALAGARTLACDRNAGDAAADHGHLEVLASERLPIRVARVHRLDEVKRT